MSDIKINLKPLNKVIAALSGKPSDTLTKQLVKVYSAYAKRRFVKLSRGGSVNGETWKPLKKSTIAARRKGKAKGKPATLRDTGKLFEALDVGAPGNLVKKIRGGVKFGYGGGAIHSGAKITLAKLARLHSKGYKNVPARPIIARPDEKTFKQLARLFKMEIDRVGVKKGGRAK